MPEKYPGTIVADNGTEGELGRHGDYRVPLSDRLIGTVGRLAVKDALTEVPAAEVAMQGHSANPPRLAVPMGKPLQLVKDEFYFLARCPVTGEILDAIHDDTGGAGGPLVGEWRVVCADCETTHAFDLSAIKPEPIKLGPPTLDGWPE